MHFRTELSVTKSLLQLHHKSHFLTLGSCFAEEIGSLLEGAKFDTLNNVFGTMFNPLSIASVLENVCHPLNVETLPVLAGDVWLDYRFHSSIYGYSEQELKDTIHHKLEKAQQQLHKPGAVLLITLGTAWVYRLLSEDAIVTNATNKNLLSSGKNCVLPKN